jgi:acetyl esterase/lipase
MPPVTDAKRNLVYAEYPGQQMLLDVYRPPADRPLPTVVFFHGGGWKSGTKDLCKVQWLTNYGFAVASVHYRLLPRFTFPAQLNDAKAAVRYLRGQARALNLDPERFAATGQSAGAYLACMLAVTAGHPQLDHPAADDPFTAEAHARQSTRIDVAVNFHGFTDLIELQREPNRRGMHRAERAPEAQLLGHAVSEDPDRARLASPIFHLPDTAPPDYPRFLHLHGDRNEVVPLDQTRRFHERLTEIGAVSKLPLLRGAGHNDRQLFNTPSIHDRVADFLHRHLKTDGVRAAQEARVRHKDGSRA